jgi:hypothetical protein
VSVAEFEKAVSRRSSLRFAIVSQALFYALDDAGKVDIKKMNKDLPTHRLNAGPVLVELLRSLDGREKVIPITYFVLKDRPDIHIDCVLLHGLYFDDYGPKSFLLYG